MRKRLGILFWIAVLWIVLVVFLAIFRDSLPIADPVARLARSGECERFERPSWSRWFGCDNAGRDIFARSVEGARPALVLGVVVTGIAGTIGTLVGVISGYIRGLFDTVMTTIVDISLAFPALVLLIAVSVAFEPSLRVFVIVFSILGIPGYARIVRGATFALAEREFVDASESMGATRARIVRRELLPNVALPVLSFAFIGFALVIIAEGGLAFLNLSLDGITWGKEISEGRHFIVDHPHVSLIPSTVMFLTILAFNLVGDGLRSLVAPREVATARRLHIEGTPEPRSEGDDAVLRIVDLSTKLHTPGGLVEPVDQVSLSLAPGEALGIVGESGSGKTMILRSIVGAFPLADVTRAGTVEVDGVDMLRSADTVSRRTLGTNIGMVSQNPLTALNPVRRVGDQVIEPMIVHGDLSRADARERALELLQQVGIPAAERCLREYPHQLSGGMRQRVTIAIALANEPKLLLADEPTSALDVTVQDQILRLLDGLRRERGMGMVLVTHDLAVVKGFTDNVAIVYAGQVVEYGPTAEIFANPQHRYTVALMNSMPDLNLPSHSELTTIEGAPPSLIDPPSGCRFAERCPAVQDKCRTDDPVRAGTDVHSYSCWFPMSEHPVEVS
ncbi:MAG: dipeptide/oligopeptide/nickel ABC transporter permease/ATP-binding protein [Acidimicrobiales bacterium]|nr:dipeptide/oligopeptide/nickel ABC transporter permease/ATP-binding protein [Acidimicrobiales bacterium]